MRQDFVFQHPALDLLQSFFSISGPQSPKLYIGPIDLLKDYQSLPS
jgi:hypothetical protein